MDNLTIRDLALIAVVLSETLPHPHADEYDAHEAALDKISDELDKRRNVQFDRPKLARIY